MPSDAGARADRARAERTARERASPSHSTAMRPASAIRPAYSVLDVEPFNRLIGRPMRPWRDALAPYVGAARKAGGRGRGRAPRQTTVAEKPARSNREETSAIRQWGRK